LRYFRALSFRELTFYKRLVFPQRFAGNCWRQIDSFSLCAKKLIFRGRLHGRLLEVRQQNVLDKIAARLERFVVEKLQLIEFRRRTGGHAKNFHRILVGLCVENRGKIQRRKILVFSKPRERVLQKIKLREIKSREM
jgi:hypothetical protein